MDIGNGNGSNVKVVESSRRVAKCEVILRIMGLLLTLVAVIVTAVDKQTKTISVTLSNNLPTVHLAVTAKWHYMSAFVYFLVANAIAFSYAAASLVISAAIRTAKDRTTMTTLVVVVLDMTMMGLLFSANGAAIAVGVLGQHGNSHVQWNKVCNLFQGFCHKMTAAIVLSLGGCLVFFWLVALAILNLHKKSK